MVSLYAREILKKKIFTHPAKNDLNKREKRNIVNEQTFKNEYPAIKIFSTYI